MGTVERVGKSGGALAGVRVLDLTWGPVGAIATMLLADHGAEVIRVDRPGGDPIRRGGGMSTWDRGKHSAELDLRSADDLAAVRALAETADVVVDGLGAGRCERFGLDDASIRPANPMLVTCGISVTGPEADDPMMAYDPLAAARFGVMAETGGVREGPIFPGHPAATYATGLLAAVGTLACLRARLVSGRGQRIDVSNRDGVLALSTMEWWSERGISFIHAKRRNNRLDLGRRPLLLEHYTCADGGILQVNTAAPGAFDRAMHVFGIADRISVVGAPAGAQLSDADLHVLRHVLPEIVGNRTLDHWTKHLWTNSVACQPIQAPGEIFDDDQVRHAGAIREVEHPDLGTVEVVGPVIELSASPPPPLGSIERLGASSARARSGWRGPGLASEGRTESALESPLSGIRILELSSFFASPYGNRLLADLGADVVKVEPPGGDPQRALPDPAENVNAGKRSIVIDLKSPGGRPAVEQLLRWADVVQHNLRPGSVERLGLDEASVRAMNDEVIYAYGPGYGATGPKATLQSFAPLHSGLVGLMHLAAGEDNDPVVPFGNEDYYTGLLLAAGTLLALIHRERTGTGQYVEVSQLLATTFTASEIFRSGGCVRSALPRLDADQNGWSPYIRLYCCADGWICVCAVHEDQRLALRQLVRSGTTDDDVPERALVSGLETWFACTAVEDGRALLRDRGVPCEVARETHWLAEHLSDPAVIASGDAVEIESALHGRVRVIGNLFRVQGFVRPPHRRAPRPGEHTEAVLRELRFGPDARQQLRAAGAVVAEQG